MAEEERAGEGAVLLVLRRRPRGARAPKSLQFIRSGGADKGTRDMHLGRGRGEGRKRGDEGGARMLGSPAGLPS